MSSNQDETQSLWRETAIAAPTLEKLTEASSISSNFA